MKILKSKKFVLVLLLALAALFAGLELYRDDAGLSLGETIETRGSRILGTRLTVGDVSLDSGGGRIVLSDLALANPGGFASSDMISVNSVEMRLDRDSRVIERMTFSGVAAVIELRGARGNFENLADRVAKRATRNSGAGASGGTGEDEETGRSANPVEREDGAADGQTPARDDWRVNQVEFDRIGVRVQADWTPEVLEFDAGGLSVGPLDAGADDLARAVAVQFLHRVLVSAAEQVDDERLKAGLLDRARALRGDR